MWKVLILSLLIIGLAIAAIAIKILVQKNGEFKKSCSSVDPNTGQRLGCTCGNAEGAAACDNKPEV